MCRTIAHINILPYLCRIKYYSPMKRVTIKDIAHSLRLSPSTVSRALSDDKNIRKETKQRIFKMAEELGYRRNNLAASLRCGQTHTVGVIASEMLSPFSSLVLNGIQEVMHRNGVCLLVANSDNSSGQELRNLQIMENSLVEGIIMSAVDRSNNADELKRIRAKGIPVVCFAHAPAGLDIPRVVTNDYDKALYLMDHLVCSGRRRIVHVKGPENCSGITDIHKAYLDSLKRFRIDFDPTLVRPASISIEEGRRVATELTEEKVAFDALFACDDLIAIGAMNRLRELGVRIPEDVSIAGFYGSPLSRIVFPPLTTVEPPLLEMGQKAAELLLLQINNPEAKAGKVIVDARLQLRASTNHA